jgi:hypothetical protein
MAQEITQSLFGLDAPMREPQRAAGLEGVLQRLEASASAGITRGFGQKTAVEVQQAKFKAITQQMQEQGINIASPQGLTELGNRLTSAGLTGMGTAMMMQGRNQFLSEQTRLAEIAKFQAQERKASRPESAIKDPIKEAYFNSIKDKVRKKYPNISEDEVTKLASIRFRREEQKNKVEQMAATAGIETGAYKTEKDYEQQIKNYEKFEEGYMKSMPSNINIYENYSNFKNIINEGLVGFPGVESVIDLAKIGKLVFGLDIEGLEEGEQIQQILNQVVAGKARLLPGAFSNKELDLMRAAFGSAKLTRGTLEKLAKDIYKSQIETLVQNQISKVFEESNMPYERFKPATIRSKVKEITDKIYRDSVNTSISNSFLINKMIESEVNTQIRF